MMPPKPKKSEKVSTEGGNVNEEPPAWLMPCLERLELSIITGFKSEMASLESRLGSRIKSIDIRIKASETKITLLEEQKEQMRSDIDDLSSKFEELESDLLSKETKIEHLEATLDDLRNRQMRKTLVFRGFPEGAEGKDTWVNCKSHISNFIVSHLDFADVEIERAHRAARKSASNDRPRPIFVEFLRWSDSSEILDAAPKILQEHPYQINGKTVHIYIDQMVSKKVQEQRSEVLLVRKYLKAENKDWKMFVRYPALLFYKSESMTQYKIFEVTDEIKSASLSYQRDLAKGKRRK